MSFFAHDGKWEVYYSWLHIKQFSLTHFYKRNIPLMENISKFKLEKKTIFWQYRRIEPTSLAWSSFVSQWFQCCFCCCCCCCCCVGGELLRFTEQSTHKLSTGCSNLILKIHPHISVTGWIIFVINFSILYSTIST